MSFSERFEFYACTGDAIACDADGFRIVARLVADDCPDAPDQRQDGFWPSLYIVDPRFIGPGNGFRKRFADAQARAERVMDAWREGDWFYAGLVLSVSLDGVILDEHAISLWGIEVNLPDTDNSSLTAFANELLPEALVIARAAAARVCAALQAIDSS